MHSSNLKHPILLFQNIFILKVNSLLKTLKSLEQKKKKTMQLMLCSHFISGFPNFKEANGRMKSIKYGQWHRYMRYNRP